MALLEVKGLGISFGGLRAVDDLNMKVEKGSLVGLIGPNGAGKTTAFNLLTGVYEPTDGIIMLDGVNLVGKKTAGNLCGGYCPYVSKYPAFFPDERAGQC